MFESILFFSLFVVSVVVGFYYVVEGNFFKALYKSKRVGKAALLASKEAVKTGRKGIETSSSVYKEAEVELKYEYAKAGLDYEEVKFKEDLAMARSIKSVFKEINDSLDKTKRESDERTLELEIKLESLASKL